MTELTAIVVASNTKNLLKTAVESFRKFHPDISLIIIDGSDPGSECYFYAKTLRSEVTEVVVCGYNIGHAGGMNAGISLVTTKYALLFDSDAEMIKSPVESMLNMMEEDTFGVGYIIEIGSDGYDYGTWPHHLAEKPIKYLHPYFQLINVANYRKFTPYIHHGAPCYKTMVQIAQLGLSDKILKDFPGLGHSSGEGINWKGEQREFIKHDPGGTRYDRKAKGKPEIEGVWIR
jgi:hypothetical protein